MYDDRFAKFIQMIQVYIGDDWLQHFGCKTNTLFI